jgi:glycerophosphoryl diester phosphodiesterase
VLNLCRDRIGVIIELKYYGHNQRLEQRVVELVEQTGMTRQVMIMSLKPEGIKKLRALRPAWKCGLLLSVAVGDLKTVEADFLAVNAKFASRALVQQTHSAGKQIFVWTVDEPAAMSSLMNRGVDGILTNRPEIARRVIESRAQMSLTERLLTELAAMLRADKKQIPEEP